MHSAENTLGRLPPELLLEICSYLDNEDLLLLSLAWKCFLKNFGAPFDPGHPARLALRERIQDEFVWRLLLESWFKDTSKWTRPPLECLQIIGYLMQPYFFQILEEFVRLWEGSVVRCFPLYLAVQAEIPLPEPVFEEWSARSRSFQNSLRFCLDLSKEIMPDRMERFLNAVRWIRLAPCVSKLEISLTDLEAPAFLQHFASLAGIQELVLYTFFDEAELVQKLVGVLSKSLHLESLEWAPRKKPFLNADMFCALLRAPSICALNVEWLDFVDSDSYSWSTVTDVLTSHPRLHTLQLTANNRESKLKTVQLVSILRGCTRSTILRELLLDQTSLDDEVVFSELCNLVRDNRSIESISLMNCSIPGNSVPKLLHALRQNQTLQSLNLHGNPFGNDGVQLFMKTYLKGTLGRLDNLCLFCTEASVDDVEEEMIEFGKKAGYACTKLDWIKEEESYEFTSKQVDERLGQRRKLHVSFEY